MRSRPSGGRGTEKNLLRITPRSLMRLDTTAVLIRFFFTRSDHERRRWDLMNADRRAEGSLEKRWVRVWGVRSCNGAIIRTIFAFECVCLFEVGVCSAATLQTVTWTKMNDRFSIRDHNQELWQPCSLNIRFMSQVVQLSRRSAISASLRVPSMEGNKVESMFYGGSC